MNQAQILPHQILREPIKRHILRPQPIRGCDAAHTGYLVHIHQGPRPGIQCRVLAIDEHHPGHHTDVVLPPMPQLMPPLLEDDLIFGDLIRGPEVRVRLIQKNRLKHMFLERLRGFIARGPFLAAGVRVLAELVLVVGAIEGHLDLLRVLLVAVGVVHGPVARGFAVGLAVLDLVLGEGDLVFLLLVLGLGAQGVREGGLVVVGEVGGVGVGDGDVVEEFGAAEDEAFPPGGGFAQEFLGGVGEDAEDQFVVVFFCDALGGIGGAAGVFFIRNFVCGVVEGSRVYDNAVLGRA